MLKHMFDIDSQSSPRELAPPVATDKISNHLLATSFVVLFSYYASVVFWEHP